MTKHLLTLKAHDAMGEVTWDDEAGTFVGTDGDILTACAQRPQAHPAWPSVEATAQRNPRAVVVLLACFGWDVPPELAETVAGWPEAALPLPSGAVA